MPMHLIGAFLLAMKGVFQMAINEQILTGRKWRRLIDKDAGLWQRISYWTHSSDVEFNDGKNAETKVGAIDGITDSLVSTSSNIAASAKALSQVNNNLANSFKGIDTTKQLKALSSGSWTATENCYAFMYATSSSAGYLVQITLDDVQIYRNADIYSHGIWVPVLKGQTIKIISTNLNSAYVVFYALK